MTGRPLGWQLCTGICALGLLFATGDEAAGQTSNTIVGPALPVAPGSIVNLTVVGVGAKLTTPVTASGFPLPTTLAGISVMLQQRGGTQSIPAPLLAVTPLSSCPNAPPANETCSRYTQVTIQIPFELDVSQQGSSFQGLVVTENGASGGALEVFGVPYQIQTLAVTHADGTIANWQNPAKSGEVLVLYALGLGATTPPAATGQPSPIPAPATQFTPALGFDYRPNAPPTLPYCSPASQCPKTYPVFSGLTPGYAGLYQLNFVVPAPPAGTPPCTVPSGNSQSVASNLTVTLIGPIALTGGQLCVDPTSGS